MEFQYHFHKICDSNWQNKYSCKYDANCIEFFINGKVVYETDEKPFILHLGCSRRNI